MIFIPENTTQTPSTPTVPTKAVSKTALMWAEIGADFKKSKMTARAYTTKHGYNYGTFTKNMHRYKDSIENKIALDAISKKKRLNKNERAIAMINSFRSSLKAKSTMGKMSARKKSEEWFRTTLKNGVRGHTVVKPTVGKLYAYVYDAKHKDTLPYWDVYPLIIFLGTAKKGKNTLMYGLNLHYIPPKARQQFLEELLKQYATTNTITNNTRLRIDWGRVKGFKGANAMIKAYIPDRIQGNLVEIKPIDWGNVVMMPLQQFKSKGSNYTASKVWADSMKK